MQQCIGIVILYSAMIKYNITDHEYQCTVHRKCIAANITSAKMKYSVSAKCLFIAFTACGANF